MFFIEVLHNADLGLEVLQSVSILLLKLVGLSKVFQQSLMSVGVGEHIVGKVVEGIGEKEDHDNLSELVNE